MERKYEKKLDFFVLSSARKKFDRAAISFKKHC